MRQLLATGAAFAYLVILSLLFCFAYAGRDAVVHAYASHDQMHFIQVGMSLGAGDWLGPYTELTHAKGMGFPAFLALVHLAGLSITLAHGLAYLTATLLFAHVTARGCRAPALFPVLATLLLALPALATANYTRINRHFFYASLTTILLALLFELFVVRSIPRIVVAGLAGLFGAWFWLTREEGVWLAPALAVLVGGSLLLAPIGRRRAAATDTLVRLCLFGTITAGLVFAVALANRFVYGSLVVNDLTRGPFVTALGALQRAGYPDRRPRISVTREARLQIYATCPSFDALRPSIDPPGKAPPWSGPGCRWDPTTCGDIANGWFTWNLRQAAAEAGAYARPALAAAFYRQLTKEVELACAEGRLRCASWLPPLVGPVSPEQWPAIVRSLHSVVRLALLLAPIDTADRPTVLHPDSRDQILGFLGDPPYTPEPGSGPPGRTSRWSAFAEGWRSLTAASRPLYVGFLWVGLVALCINCVAFARTRVASVSLILSLALLAVVSARVAILTLIDALAFPGALYDYALPASQYLVALAAISVTELWRWAAERRRVEAI